MRDQAAAPPAVSPLGWKRPDAESDARARQVSAAKLQTLFDGQRFTSEIEMRLAAGAVCPFSTWHDKAIWLAELDRIAVERGYFQ